MFTQFFGLKYNPFGKEIAAQDLFNSQDMAELAARLKHSALNMSPLDFFMAQVSRVKLVTDIERLNENFLLRVSRRVASDSDIIIK
jgi:hypothetical protein